MEKLAFPVKKQYKGEIKSQHIANVSPSKWPSSVNSKRLISDRFPKELEILIFSYVTAFE